jgi:hypothetical protein
MLLRRTRREYKPPPIHKQSALPGETIAVGAEKQSDLARRRFNRHVDAEIRRAKVR